MQSQGLKIRLCEGDEVLLEHLVPLPVSLPACLLMPAALQNLTWYLYLFCFLSTVLTPVFLIFPDSRKDSTDSVIVKYLWQSTLTHKSPPGTKTDNKASHQSWDSLGVDVVNLVFMEGWGGNDGHLGVTRILLLTLPEPKSDSCPGVFVSSGSLLVCGWFPCSCY